jgi:hypothetical protein
VIDRQFSFGSSGGKVQLLAVLLLIVAPERTGATRRRLPSTFIEVVVALHKTKMGKVMFFVS